MQVQHPPGHRPHPAGHLQKKKSPLTIAPALLKRELFPSMSRWGAEGMGGGGTASQIVLNAGAT